MCVYIAPFLTLKDENGLERIENRIETATTHLHRDIIYIPAGWRQCPGHQLDHIVNMQITYSNILLRCHVMH